MKKGSTRIVLLFLFLVVFCLLGSTAVLAAESFTDIKGHWAGQVVEKSYALNLMKGYPGDVFKPEDPVSRLEAIAIILRAMGLEEEAKKVDWKNSGIKLPSGMFWGQGHLVMAAEKGLIHRDYVHQLRYSNPISRYEVATLMSLALKDKLKVKGDISLLTFSDTDEILSEYKPFVADVTQNNIMQGISDNEFGPNENMKRGQMAALVVKAVKDGWFSYGSESTITGSLRAVDSDAEIITITKTDGTHLFRMINNQTILYRNGKPSSLDSFQIGDQIMAISGESGEVKYLESAGSNAAAPAEPVVNDDNPTTPTSSSKEAEVRTVDEFYRMITVRFEDGTRKEYEVETNAIIEKGDDRIRIEALEQDDNIAFKVGSNGKIYEITSVGEGVRKVSGKVTDLRTGDNPRIYVDEDRFTVISKVEITRDGDDIDLEDIMIGTEVSLDLDEDDQVIAIEITDDEDITVEGTVTRVDEDNSRITIQQSDDLEFTLRVDSDCTFRDTTSSSSGVSELGEIRKGWEVRLSLDNGRVQSLRVIDK